MQLRRLFLIKLLGLSSLLAVSLGWRRPFLVSAALLLIGGSMAYLRNSSSDVLLFTYAGLSGTVAEAIGIYFGAWSYTEPFAYGVPVWLPLLWGVAALYIVTVRDTMNELSKFPVQ